MSSRPLPRQPTEGNGGFAGQGTAGAGAAMGVPVELGLPVDGHLTGRDAFPKLFMLPPLPLCLRSGREWLWYVRAYFITLPRQHTGQDNTGLQPDVNRT